MKRLLIAAALALSACSVGDLAPPATPSSVANQTALDEQIAVSVELAYKAARTAVELGVDTGVIKGARATQVAGLDNKAFAAVEAVRAAYRAGNASSYLTAATDAQRAVAALLALTGR